MAKDATVKVNITGSSKGLNKALGTGNKSLDKFSKKAGNVGRKLTSMGKSLTLGVTLPLVGAATVATKWASDMEESVAKVDNVFGEHANKIHEYTQDAARSYGLSTGEAEAAFGQIGNVLSALGVEAEVLPDLSASVLQLGTDLGSFHNLETDDVLNRINAALVGEYDSLKKIAPGVSALAVSNEALAMTGKSAAAELTNEDKALAALELITKSAANAQDDFAETSDGLANSSKIAAAELKTAGEEIGQRLTPVVAKLATKVSGLLKSFTELSPAGQNLVLIFGGIAAAVGPLLMVVGTIAKGISALSGLAALTPVFMAIGSAAQFMWTSILAPLLPIIIAVAAIVAVFALLYFHVQPIRDAVDGLVDAFQNGLGVALDWIVNTVWPKVQSFLEDMGDKLTEIADDVIPVIVDALTWFFDSLSAGFKEIQPALESVIGFIGEVLGLLADTFRITFMIIGGLISVFIATFKLLLPVIQGVITVLTAIFKPFFTVLAAIFRVGLAVITAIWNAVWPVMAAVMNVIFTNIKAIITAALGFIKGVFDFWTSFIEDGWSGMWDKLKAAVSAAWGAISRFVMAGINKVKALISNGLNVITSKWSGAWNGIKNTLSNIWGGITSTVSNSVSHIVNIIKSLPGRINGVLGSIGSAARGIGSAIMNGIKNGLSSAAGFAGDVASGVWRAVKGSINSNVIDRLNSAIPNTLGAGPFSVSLPANPVPRLAMGTGSFTGGVAMVGERGPETVFLPGGSSVAPNHGGGGKTSTEITINANTNVSADTIASELNWLLNYSGR